MKKLTTALLAAGLVLSASACVGHPQLTTAETCERIKIVLSSPSASQGKTGMVRVANQIRSIEPVASDDLKPAVQAILDFVDESGKDEPDSGKLAELKTGYDKAGSTYSELCS
jgi:hypothetical protein